MREPLIDDSESDIRSAVRFLIDALMDGDVIRVNPFFALSVQSFWGMDGELADHGVELDADEFALLVVGGSRSVDRGLEIIREHVRDAMRRWLLETELGKTVIDTRLSEMAVERHECAEDNRSKLEIAT